MVLKQLKQIIHKCEPNANANPNAKIRTTKPYPGSYSFIYEQKLLVYGRNILEDPSPKMSELN